MFKDQLLREGVHEAPDDMEINILLYAAEKIKKNESEIELGNYLSWLPFVGTILLVKDFISGQKVRISPILEI